MKVLAAILMFISVGIIARAQTPPVAVTAPAVEARVVAEIAAAGMRSGVKNSPFSAEAISESVQTLADGNRIVRTSTSKLYRNSEGRFRQESAGGSGGAFGSFFTYGDGVTIMSPGQFSYQLDAETKIARAYQDLAGQAITLAPLAATTAVRAVDAVRLTPEAKADLERLNAEVDKVKASKEQIAAVKDELKAAAERVAATSVYSTGAGNAVMAFPSVARGPKYESRTEDLGDQSYEGVSAHGTRTVTTIPAGAVGNERPIEITYEKWFSDELQMVVYSKQSDPRTGEHTYRLTNINRSEPDPSLFKIPSGYKVLSGNQSVYTVNGQGEGGTWVKSSGGQGQGATYVKSTTATGGTRTKNQN
jgi:hypothetical protein